MNRKALKTLVFVSLAIFYGSFLLHKIELPAGDDMARHVKNGELMMQGNFDVIKFNIYSYTEPKHEFINHNWLSNVIFYLLHQAVGWSGLIFFKVAILISSFAIMFFVSVKKADFWLVALLSIPAILILKDRSALRPEIFSYLFIAIFLFFLNDFEENPKGNKIFWLIPIQVLWVNTHLFFMVGVALVGGFLLERLILNRKKISGVPAVKKLAVLLGLLILACLINPNFVLGATYPFQIFSNYGIEVGENQSLLYVLRNYPNTFLSTANIFIFSTGLLILSFILYFFKKPLTANRSWPIFYSLSSAAMAISGFAITRLIAFFGLFFMLSASANLQGTWLGLINSLKRSRYLKANLDKYVLTIVAAVSILVFWVSLDRLYDKLEVGLAAGSNSSAEFFRNNKLRGPVFNDYDIGSYLTYHLFPDERVFVDNRPEAYSEQFFEGVYVPIIRDGSDVEWEKALEKYKFNAIFLYQYDEGPGFRGFMYRRIHDPAWALVYTDAYAVILLRKNENNLAVIKEFEINQNNAEEKLAQLIKSNNFNDQVAAADMLYLLNRKDLGARTFLKIVSRWPGEARIWMVMGEWESNSNPHLAIEYLHKAINLGQKTAEAYSFLGLAYARLGEYEKAFKALRTALNINPDREDAKKLLNSLLDENY